MKQAQSLKPHTDSSLAAACRSKLYAFFARAVAVPDEEFFRIMADQAFNEGLESVRQELPYTLDLRLIPDQPAGDFATVQSAYIAAFDVGIKGPPCPLNEGAHRKGSSRKGIMEGLIRFYNHFGLHMPEKITELPDHLITELEFMHYLCFEQASTLDKGLNAESLILAQRDFLKRHIGAWLPSVNSRISLNDEIPFHSHILGTLEEYIRADLGYLQSCIAKEL